LFALDRENVFNFSCRLEHPRRSGSPHLPPRSIRSGSVAHWGAQIRAEDTQQIQEIVKAYPECANLFYDERVVIPLEPDLITIKVPSNAFADIRRAQTVLVDPEEYAESSPDLWSLDLEPIRSHLERHHQKELLSIVAQISTVAVPVDSTVLVRDIERHQLSVACLNNDGVTRFNIGYDCQIRCPGQLTDWLYQQNN
jgi:hypothetical protein